VLTPDDGCCPQVLSLSRFLSEISFARYQVGEIMKNPDLAATFELMAEKGIDEFYSGQLAQEIVDAAQVIKAWMRKRIILASLSRHDAGF
jgi:hypothetical protein